jgi:phosphohistidine phosphatase
MHTLLVLRHAKAAGEPGVNDHERPLKGRGRRNATAAGRWLVAVSLAPDRVVCSSSRRTRETWELVSAALGAAAPDQEGVSVDRRVYDAGSRDLLDIVREQPEEAGGVMMVGHNPASHQLAVDLSGRSDFPFPTCALAVIKLSGSWADAVPGGGELTMYWNPHTLSARGSDPPEPPGATMAPGGEPP